MSGDRFSDADIKAAEPVMLVKIAAGTQAATGALIALSGFQLKFAGVQFYGEYEALRFMPWVMMIGGVMQLAIATQFYRARPWAAYTGAVFGVLMSLEILGWSAFSVMEQLFSCLVLVAAPLSMLAAILAVVTIGEVRKTAAARRRLAEQGLALGL